MSPLEKWLSDATRGLSAESAVQVRAEIQEHYDSAREAGDDAITALGDPRAANRAYRKVLLTQQEAMLAPVLTRHKRPGLSEILLSSAMLAPFIWLLTRKQHDPGFWPVMIAILCTVPLSWFFPATTLKRSRTRAYLAGVQAAVVAGVSCWYQGWVVGLPTGAFFLLLNYLPYYLRTPIFRKLAAGQTYSPLAEEPGLTHLEAIVLNRLRNGDPSEKFAAPVLLLMVAGVTVWLPATFLPMTTCLTAAFIAQRTLPIYTEERSRRFRIVKWTAMVVAAVLPALYGARIPWSGAIFMTFFFWLFDMTNISIRRKLPVPEWPRRLYW
jgi:hypothetical protein